MLATLGGLQEVMVHLSGGELIASAHGKEKRAPLLDALRPIKATKKFDVLLPWSEGECAQVAKEESYPFRLAPRVEVKVPMRDGDNIEL